ncbi:hypothetical protein [Sphingomonas bacterium]|uniref:hypothetical protein n=1 Tax=Sphingomonas bacterium TaxID=1895847 RepID=UPI00261F0D8F|nr:hypothetical protein [Sphingomonas bacterium]
MVVGFIRRQLGREARSLRYVIFGGQPEMSRLWDWAIGLVPSALKGEAVVNFRGALSAVTALALVAAPTAAAAAPASAAARSTTSVVTPAEETVDGENALRGGGIFVALIAAIVVILGIIIAVNEDDEPNSP